MQTRLRWLVAGLALVVAMPVTLAAAADASIPAAAGHTTPATPAIWAHDVLQHARDVLAGLPTAAGHAGDASLALRDLYLALPDLSPEDRAVATSLLARPTDGAADRYGDGYSVGEAPRQCSGTAPVCVHFVSTTADAASQKYVGDVLTTMSEVWTLETSTLGYRPPLADGTKGGGPELDVYLKDLTGIYGYCATERASATNPKLASGYCVLDNDFAQAEYGAPPLDSLQVTAAHEFFHAIQYAYDATEDSWLMEATATWMEEQYADGVNDNRQYLAFGQVKRPAVSLDVGGGLPQYGNWAFFEYLSERFTTDVVRKVWNKAAAFDGAPDKYSIQAVAAVLSTRGGLPATFAQYAAGNTIPATTYPDEGANWPSAAIAKTWTMTTGSPRASASFGIDHLASRNLVVKPGAGLTSKRWRLRITIDGPAGFTAPRAYLIIRDAAGALTQRPIALDGDGRGATTVDFSVAVTSKVTITLVNASTRYNCRQGTQYSCRGIPLDTGRTFRLGLRIFKA